MKRVTISVSDSLHRRMQKHKGDINFSLIAREAIDREIRTLELREDPSRELADIIERLRKEKEAVMDKWRKEGFELGQQWVKEASYSELQSYMDTLPELLRIGQPWPGEDVLEDYTANYSDDPEFNDSAADQFWLGFAQGASVLWKEIRERL